MPLHNRVLSTYYHCCAALRDESCNGSVAGLAGDLSLPSLIPAFFTPLLVPASLPPTQQTDLASHSFLSSYYFSQASLAALP